jgi:ketosteroid isomerase-like protein
LHQPEPPARGKEAPMTTTMNPVETITELYGAFGRGDVDAILGMLADDVTWDGDWPDHFAQRAAIPIMTPRHGKDDVAGFFAYVATLTVHDFQVLDVLGSPTQVVAQIVIEISYPHGGRFRDEELHLWTFGADGKVVRLRHYVDSAKHIAAARGEDTTKR